MTTIPRRISVSAAALLLAGCDNPEGPRTDRDACERAGVQGAYAGDVRLGVGEAMELAEGVSLCLVLPGAAGREYVLAYLDTRAIEESRTMREVPLDSVTVAVEDLAGPSAARQRLPGAPGPAWGVLPGEGGDFVQLPAAGPALTRATARATPWALGETFTLYDHLRRVDRPARVLRVYDGWLVAAAFTDEGPPTVESTLAMLDQAWPSVRQVGMPLLREVFGDRLPVTSQGSGQLLTVFREDLSPGVAGVAYGFIGSTDVFTLLAVRPNAANTTRTPASLGSLMIHEITHAFQRSYMAATRAQGTTPTGAAGNTRWGIEGGAALMQRELARRQAGLSLTANHDWKSPQPTEALRWYSVFAQPADGTLTAGYAAAAGFLADLVQRRVAAGDEVDAAVREVSRGAIEGWFGKQPEIGDGDRLGLAARMSARLGKWDPADALFAWTFSHALDDRTGSRDFQDRAFRDVWNVSEGEYGWRGHAALAVGSGERHEVTRAYGSPGYFVLTGSGGPLRLTADAPGVRWMIARAR